MRRGGQEARCCHSTHGGAHDTARAFVDGTIGARTTKPAALGRDDHSLAARRSLGIAGVGSDRAEPAMRRGGQEGGTVRHGWSLHRNGSTFAAGRRGGCGLPAGEFEPGFVYAAAVVEDFAHVSHRAHLSTPEHRTLADWWLVRRHVHLKDLIFGKVLSVFRFGAPFEIPDYAEKASGTRRHNRRGDFHVVPSEDFYDAMIDPGCRAGEGFFYDFDAWQAHWVRKGVRMSFKREWQPLYREELSKRQVHHADFVMCLHVPPEMLQLLRHDRWEVLAHSCVKTHMHRFLGSPALPPEISLDAAAICSSASCVSFDPKMFATAADHIRLRRFNVDCEEDVKRVSEEDLLAWLDAMSEHCGVSVKGALKLAATGKERVHEYAVESLITAVIS